MPHEVEKDKLEVEMRKNDKLDNYEIFYEEVPTGDYMDDIVIQDENDSASYDQFQGLSDHQVTEIARDVRDNIENDRPRSNNADDTTNEQRS
jgi:hypothetical protein